MISGDLNKVLINLGVITEADMNDIKPDLYIMEGRAFDNICWNLAPPCPCSDRWSLHSKRRVR